MYNNRPAQCTPSTCPPLQRPSPRGQSCFVQRPAVSLTSPDYFDADSRYIISSPNVSVRASLKTRTLHLVPPRCHRRAEKLTVVPNIIKHLVSFVFFLFFFSLRFFLMRIWIHTLHGEMLGLSYLVCGLATVSLTLFFPRSLLLRKLGLSSGTVSHSLDFASCVSMAPRNMFSQSLLFLVNC